MRSEDRDDSTIRDGRRHYRLSNLHSHGIDFGRWVQVKGTRCVITNVRNEAIAAGDLAPTAVVRRVVCGSRKRPLDQVGSSARANVSKWWIAVVALGLDAPAAAGVRANVNRLRLHAPTANIVVS